MVSAFVFYVMCGCCYTTAADTTTTTAAAATATNSEKKNTSFYSVFVAYKMNLSNSQLFV